jgi:hypothetical protein
MYDGVREGRWGDVRKEPSMIKATFQRRVDIDSRRASLAVMARQRDAVDVGLEHAGVFAETLADLGCGDVFALPAEGVA